MLRGLANPKNLRSFKLLTKRDAIDACAALLASGRLTPIVARTFPLDGVVEAMRCLEEGRTPGKIAITPMAR